MVASSAMPPTPETQATPEEPPRPGPTALRKELPAVALALVAGLLAIPATYAALRAWEVLTGPDPGPAIGVWTPAIALFRRAGVAAYVAGMVAPGAYVVARRGTASAARVLAHGAVVVAVLGAAQAILLP